MWLNRRMPLWFHVWNLECWMMWLVGDWSTYLFLCPFLLSFAMLFLNFIKLCQWPGVFAFLRGHHVASSPKKASLCGASLSFFAPYNVSTEWPFKINTHPSCNIKDQWSWTVAVYIQTLIELLVLVWAWELFFFFHPCRSPPPALIKRALCACGCEEGRRCSQGSDWRPEVDRGCVCVFLRTFQGQLI